jgi:hypothetical protein
MTTNHPYLTEPRWLQTRNVIQEAICVKTWIELAAIATVIFAIAVVAG